MVRGTFKALQRARWLVALSSLVCAVSLAPYANAQSLPPPPTYNALDANGVNLITRAMTVQSPTASVGQSGTGGLAYGRTYDSSIQGWRDNVTGTINSSGATYTVTLLGASETFTLTGTLPTGTFASTEAVGGTLSFNSTTQIYTYTTASGTTAAYSKALASSQPTQANEGRVTSMTLPSGEQLTFTYHELRTPALPATPTFLAHRLQSVNNNLGYQLAFEYTSNSADASGLQLKKVIALNNAIEYCDPTANGCATSGPWMSLAFAYGSGFETVTDGLSRTTRYAITSNRITGIRWPSSGSDNITVTYGASGEVAIVSTAAGNWNYSYASAGSSQQTTVTDPLGHTNEYVADLSIGRVTGYQNAVGDVWTTTWDPFGRPNYEIRPQLGFTRNFHDTRGNVTQIQIAGNYGPSPTVITVQTSTYPSTCSNSLTCNQPTSTADALGNATDYTYDTVHGGVLTVTSPDPDGAGPLTRPQTRYTYSQVTASYIQSSGASPTPAATSVWRLARVSSCATSSWTGTACSAGTSDETRTDITYGNDNRLPTSVTRGAVSGGPTATVASMYDNVGNVAQIDGPLSGADDSTYFRYDSERQRVGVIEPDPDDSGPLKHRASEFTYNAFGQITAAEVGTVNAPPSPSWPTFTALETLSRSYDVIGRLTQESLVVGGVTQALVQYSYDGANRLDCAAQRMNPSVFGSLPSSACALSTQGANGPDHITHNVYDFADRIIQVQTGYATGLQQTHLTRTFTPNGLQASLTDANGNVTTFEYDDIDRLSKIRYPNPTGGGSSTTDFEQYSYNNNSLITQNRLRDGSLVNITYDGLSRTTTIDAPSGTRDVAITYDNFSRITSQDFQGSPTFTQSFSYDQLSRNTSVTREADGVTLTVGYEYDIANRRTRITWPGSPIFYAQYDYDLAGEVTAIRQNGASSGDGVLAEFDYDNLGRRTALQRADSAGATTTYTYDAASRMSSMQQDINSTSNDPNFGFTYSAAGQLLTRTSNNFYDWPQPSNGLTTYSTNGRNQYPSVNASSVTFDGRGNLTSIGTASYGYDAFNRLTSAGVATLSYDPSGRLHQTTSNGSSVTARFLYDGSNVIAEYDDSNVLQRRFVFGPGVDEVIVEYVGGGTNDPRWLLRDQVGSVIAATDEDGLLVGNPNTYDEYGQPGAGNSGRFQYTGQIWLPEAGLYHYKARAYLPALGRFAQPDPILYDGGLNLYAYVNNDPVNNTDPLGLVDVVDTGPDIVVTGAPSGCPATQNCFSDPYGGRSAFGTRGANTGQTGEPLDDIVVVGEGCPRRATCYSGDDIEAILSQIQYDSAQCATDRLSGTAQGAVAGAVVGGVAGGLTCSPTGPGAAACAGGGMAGGSVVGGAIGNLLGGMSNACRTGNTDEPTSGRRRYPGCEVQRDRDYSVCSNSGLNRQNYRICESSANERYAYCVSHDGEIGWPPLDVRR